MKGLKIAVSVLIAGVFATPLIGQATGGLTGRIDHTDPSQFTVRESVHAGAGPMNYMRLTKTVDFLHSNLEFISRGRIMPGGGIGHHFHNTVEEMFIILDGEAEFTINGRTSRVQGPAGAPNVMGSSHAIYNPTDRPVEWMNINVSSVMGEYDTFDLGDSRVGAKLDEIPVFMVMRLDRKMLRPTERMYGGRGVVQYRRALQPTIFRTPWAYVDHLLLPPGTSTGGHSHTGVEEFYYVLSGQGTIRVATVGVRSRGPWPTESARIVKGDAIPIRFGEAHAVENTGNEPLELMIVGIARDMRKNLETLDVQLDN